MYQRSISPYVRPLLPLKWARTLVGLAVLFALLLSGHALAAMGQTGQTSASRNDVPEMVVADVLGRNDHHCRHDEHRLSSGWGLAQGKQHETQGDGGPAIGMAAPCPRSITAISGKPSPLARSALLPLYLLTQRLRP